MCGKRLKRFLPLLVLFSLLCFSPLSSSCYAEVVLTDKEAQELMSEISESRKDLTELQTQLNDVKNDYEEQKKSYEEQLKEEKKKSTEAIIFASGATATSLVISIVLLIALL